MPKFRNAEIENDFNEFLEIVEPYLQYVPEYNVHKYPDAKFVDINISFSDKATGYAKADFEKGEVIFEVSKEDSKGDLKPVEHFTMKYNPRTLGREFAKFFLGFKRNLKYQETPSLQELYEYLNKIDTEWEYFDLDEMYIVFGDNSLVWEGEKGNALFIEKGSIKKRNDDGNFRILFKIFDMEKDKLIFQEELITSARDMNGIRKEYWGMVHKKDMQFLKKYATENYGKAKSLKYKKRSSIKVKAERHIEEYKEVTDVIREYENKYRNALEYTELHSEVDTTNTMGITWIFKTRDTGINYTFSVDEGALHKGFLTSFKGGEENQHKWFETMDEVISFMVKNVDKVLGRKISMKAFLNKRRALEVKGVESLTPEVVDGYIKVIQDMVYSKNEPKIEKKPNGFIFTQEYPVYSEKHGIDENLTLKIELKDGVAKVYLSDSENDGGVIVDTIKVIDKDGDRAPTHMFEQLLDGTFRKIRKHVIDRYGRPVYVGARESLKVLSSKK